MPDKEQTTPQPQATVYTENVFASSREAVQFVRSLPAVYVLFSAPSGGRLPIVFDARCTYVFSKEEYAVRRARQLKIAACTIRRLSQPDFTELVKQCCRYGIEQFYLDDGVSGHAAIFSDYDFSIDLSIAQTGDLSNDFALQPHNGTKFYRAALWFLQLRDLKNCPETAKQKAWRNVSNALCDTVFLVPVCCDGKDGRPAVADPEIHLTERVARMLENELNTELHPSVGESNVPNDTALPNRVAGILSGGEANYHLPVHEGRFKPTQKMRVRLLHRGSQSWIPAFTDLASLLAACGNNACVGMYTFQELAMLAQSAMLPANNGIVIEPDGFPFCLNKRQVLSALDAQKNSETWELQPYIQKTIGKTSRACQRSMVYGILGLVFSVFGGGLFSLLAIIYSNRGMDEVRTFGQEGSNKALAGSIMGWIGLLLSFIFALMLRLFLRSIR